MVLFSKGFRDTAISFPALMGVSVTVLVCSFIGCVIGGNQVCEYAAMEDVRVGGRLPLFFLLPLLLFIARVFAHSLPSQMQSSINSSGNSSPGLALSIIAVVLSA